MTAIHSHSIGGVLMKRRQHQINYVNEMEAVGWFLFVCLLKLLFLNFQEKEVA